MRSISDSSSDVFFFLRLLSPLVVIRRVVVHQAAVVRPLADGVELHGVLVAVQAFLLDAEAELGPPFRIDSYADYARQNFGRDAVGVPACFRNQGDPELVVPTLRFLVRDVVEAQVVLDSLDAHVVFLNALLDALDFVEHVLVGLILPDGFLHLKWFWR